MTSSFEDIPHRIFLDSSALQTLQRYGGFLYENEVIELDDPIGRDPQGLAKLQALRQIMLVGQRAPFEFALSEASFVEVERKGDPGYLRWAYDVLDHWQACLEGSGEPQGNSRALAAIETSAYNYLGRGDRTLLRDAISLECDAFLTMENKPPKCASHIATTLGIRVLSPLTFWDILRPWAALFY